MNLTIINVNLGPSHFAKVSQVEKLCLDLAVVYGDSHPPALVNQVRQLLYSQKLFESWVS